MFRSQSSLPFHCRLNRARPCVSIRGFDFLMILIIFISHEPIFLIISIDMIIFQVSSWQGILDHIFRDICLDCVIWVRDSLWVMESGLICPVRRGPAKSTFSPLSRGFVSWTGFPRWRAGWFVLIQVQDSDKRFLGQRPREAFSSSVSASYQSFVRKNWQTWDIFTIGRSFAWRLARQTTKMSRAWVSESPVFSRVFSCSSVVNPFSTSHPRIYTGRLSIVILSAPSRSSWYLRIMAAITVPDSQR